MNPNDVRGVRQRVTAELHPHQDPSRADMSAIALATDPALNQKTTAASQAVGRGGVQWVPAAELLRRGGMRLADMHAQGQENLVRHMRHGMGQAVRKLTSHTQSKLPDVQTFGQTPVAASTEAVGR